MRLTLLLLPTALAATLATPASAVAFNFSTGGPDGRIATASGPGPGLPGETETADDFIADHKVQITGGSFTGLLPAGYRLGSGGNVELEFYRVFPGDSANPPSGVVPTRDNSPADEDFASRDSTLGELTFTTTLLDADFTAANSVINGINPLPGVLTGGEGAVIGQVVRFDFTFASALTLDAGHYFFRPEVGIGEGQFLWLSAAKPILAPGTPFAPDLQSWIRNGNITPDWLRIGTDITGQAPFNASFALDGSTVPEPASWALMVAGFGLVGAASRRRSSQTVAA